MSKIQLDDLTVNNNNLLRVINEASLPIKYDDKFYKDAYSEGYTQLAFYGEVPIGVLKAKSIIPSGSTTPTSLYIESLAVLKPYRNQSAGSRLLEWLEDQATQAYLHQLTLHVWIKNSEALDWYKKQGFEIQGEAKDYYKSWGIEQPDAVLLVKKI